MWPKNYPRASNTTIKQLDLNVLIAGPTFIWAGKKMITTHLVKQWKEEVSDRAKEVDPNNKEDWYSLCLGWAIGKGLTPDDAYAFATYIRYKTNLG